MDSTSDGPSEREEDSGIESSVPDPSDNTLYIRIAIPDLKLQKCLQFHQDDLVWAAKQTILQTLAKDIKDGLNYGLYCPPMNGRAGKFLDEERPLKDYPLPGPIGFLEFKYKRRVYKMMQLNARKLKQLHTKANLKQFTESVRTANIDRIHKFTIRGLDPNFVDPETKETPLTLSCTLSKPRDVIIALVSGGCHLDFRTRDGLTAMHRAASKGNFEAIKTLLDLGSSPNYRDRRGLSPLYYAVCNDTNAHCVELLLHDHSLIGVTDDSGSTEIHQACKYGRVQHLEHLLFYGAEMNSQNSSGNTALHVAAVNNQESCARVLLFRGADKTVLNYANQDAWQVAVIAGNTDLADVIKGFKPDDVVPFQEIPKYNDKRRGVLPSLSTLHRSRSDPRLNLTFSGKPSSPCLSSDSYPHYSSNGHLFDPGSAGMLFRQGYDSDSPRSMSISSAGSLSVKTAPPRWVDKRTLSLDSRPPPYPGPRTSSSSTGYTYSRQRLYPAMPGRTFVCVKAFKPTIEAELKLKKGQIVEVLSVGEAGYWEGRVGNKEGWFPSYCVEEVKMRKKGPKSPPDHDAILIRRQTLQQLTQGDGDNAPRTVVLQKGSSGFGFVLRGAKAQSNQNSSLEFTPTLDFPALQYLDRVDKGSMADKAGLKPNDFVLEINGESVVNATHEHTVELIKRSGDTLAMRVITVKPLSAEGHERDIHMDGTRTLPLKKKALAPAPPKRHPHTSLTNSVAGKAKTMIDSLAELDRLDRTLALYDESDSRSMGAAHASSALDSAAIRRGVDPNNKTASIRSRHSGKRLTAFEIEGMFADQAALVPKPVVVVPPKTYASPTEQKVARMKGRLPANGTASLSRARSTPSLVPGSMGLPVTSHPHHPHHVTRVVIQDGGIPDEGRVMYESPASSPGYQSINSPDEALYAVPMKPKSLHREDSPVYAETGIHPQGTPPRAPSSQGSHYSGDSIPPPPTHPPPVPPTPPTRSSSQAGEVVKINTSSPTYANVSQQIQQQQALKKESSIESSFRPGAAARMSKEPAVLPPTPQAPRLSNSVSSTSTMSSASDQYAHSASPVNRSGQYTVTSSNTSSPQRNTHDSVHESARRFMQDDAVSPSYVATASHGRESHHPPPPTSRAQYYEPEPDYDVVTREITTKEVIRQSPVSVVNKQSSSPVVNRQAQPSPVRRPSPVSSNRNSPSPVVSRQSPATPRQNASPASYQRSSSNDRTPEVVNRRVVEETKVKTEVQSIRESWQSKQGRKSFDETDKTVVVSPKPTTPKQEENSMSAFGNAIKVAAAARDKRNEDSPKAQELAPRKVPTPPPAPPVKKQSTPPPPPPPGPPPPIPASNNSPGSQPPSVRKNHLPPHVQKSLEENRQREDTHAAIMAAVARRRNIVDNGDMAKMADTIENKVQKAKKLQSTVYKSDKKEVISPQATPVKVQENKGFKKAPTPPPKSTTVESSVKTVEVKTEVVRMDNKPERAQKPPENFKSPKPAQEASVMTTEVKSSEPTNFTAMAERARQEYLQKRTGQTLERKKKPTAEGEEGEEDDKDNNNVSYKSPPPVVSAKPDRNGFSGNHSGNGNGSPSSAMGDLATIIAQKAAARQKSYEGTADSGSKNNGNVGNGYQHTTSHHMAPMGVNSNNHNSAGSRQSVEIQGATLDSSNTEMFERNEENQGKALGSVFQRTQIFESQKAMLKKTPTNSGSKTVYRGDGSKADGQILPPAAFGDESPPPMVPPPSSAPHSNLDIVSNGHDRHGNETVGWVINSGPTKHSHEYAVRSKAALHRSSHGIDDSNGEVATITGGEYAPPVAEVFEVDFIPPPPLFDSAELNAIVGSGSTTAQQEETASMVSSVSTLSTLSSTEQEASSPRQSYRVTGSPENDGAPPPPPGFGDILDPPADLAGASFIPPPLGFEIAGAEQPHPMSSLRSVIKNGAYQNKPIASWSTADVCEWLDSIQLSSLKVNFSKNKITGQKLMQLGRNELIALGVTNVGDRMSIERAIKQAMMNS